MRRLRNLVAAGAAGPALSLSVVAGPGRAGTRAGPGRHPRPPRPRRRRKGPGSRACSCRPPPVPARTGSTMVRPPTWSDL